MAYIYELVVTEGPLLGRVFRVEPHTTLMIGRTCRDIPLFQDERASLEHAELSWTARGFWVRDLDSEGGTFVEGLPIPKAGRVLGVGSTVRMGQTVMRLQERRSIPAWAGWSLAVGIPLVGVLITVAALAVRGVDYEPAVRFAAPIAQGAVTSDVVDVPTWMLRRYGRDHRALVSRRVTDYDEDGRSELWMPFDDREVVVEIDADDGWTLLGELPLDCSDRAGLVFPDQECGGRRFRWNEDGYVAVQLASPVAWLSPLVQLSDEPDDDGVFTTMAGEPQPYRVTVAQVPRLAGFLAERGVTSPIHYLVCEGVFPGVRAQVLTESGQLVALESGCLGALSVSGPGLDDTMSREDPVAIAFTANGYEALQNDARNWVLGDPEGLFSDDVARPHLDAFLLSPENRAVRITVDEESASRVVVADEARLTGVRTWLHGDDVAPATPMLVASIDSQGIARFDVPGCALVEVETSSWHCLLRRWCTPGSQFLTAREVGCSETPVPLMSAPFSGGVYNAASADVEMWARVDVYGAAGQIDVTRVRVGFREPVERPAESPGAQSEDIGTDALP